MTAMKHSGIEMDLHLVLLTCSSFKLPVMFANSLEYEVSRYSGFKILWTAKSYVHYWPQL